MDKKRCSKLCPDAAPASKNGAFLLCYLINDWKRPGDKCEAREEPLGVPRAVTKDEKKGD